jgi:hypothetical protein
MLTSTKDRMASVEPWSSTLFLLAGALFLIAAVNNSLQIFIDGYDPAAISVPFLLIGLVAAFIGISGLYSRLREQSPTLAGLGLGVIVLALVGVTVLLIWAIANYSGIASEPAPPVALGTLAMMILGFVLAGITVLRTEAYPRLVGLLLITEAVALIFVFAGPALFQGDPPQWFGGVIEGFQALVLLGIGNTLRGHSYREGAEPAPDTTAR